MIKLKGSVGMGGSVKTNREVCSQCGQPLVGLLWSKSEPGQRKYILTCDNPGCRCYRNPVKTVTKEGGNEAGKGQGNSRGAGGAA